MNSLHPRTDETVQEIIASVQDREGSFRMAHHPLYVSIWTHEALDDDKCNIAFPDNVTRPVMGKQWLRQHISYKLESLDKAKADGDASHYVFLHERPYRPEALAHIMGGMETFKLEAPEFCRLALDVWTDTESPHQSYDFWRQVWNKYPLYRYRLAMSSEEHNRFGDLPDWLTIYRGIGFEDTPQGSVTESAAAEGFSWTLSKERAVWFAKRFNRFPYVVSSQVYKEDIIGPLMSRGEDEIIVPLPEALIFQLEDI